MPAQKNKQRWEALVERLKRLGPFSRASGSLDSEAAVPPGQADTATEGGLAALTDAIRQVVDGQLDAPMPDCPPGSAMHALVEQTERMRSRLRALSQIIEDHTRRYGVSADP